MARGRLHLIARDLEDGWIVEVMDWAAFLRWISVWS